VLTSPFFRRLFLPYLLLICAAVGGVGLVGAMRLHRSYMEHTRSVLGEETQLIAQILGLDLRAERAAEMNAQVGRLGRMLARRITVISADGRVIADTEADPATMENHRSRPEIVTAATRGQGEGVRASDTVHDDLMYFAQRVQGADGQIYYLRASVHLRELHRHLRAFYLGIALAAAVAILGAALICYYFARRTAQPLIELTSFADALRRGDLTRRTLRKEKGEVGTLATALESMADALSDLISRIRQDQAQLLAILSSMSEGVIATDFRQRILLSNAAAAHLLDMPADSPPAGRLLWEAVRSQPVLQAAGEVLTTGQRRGLQVGPIDGRHLVVTVSTFPPAAAPEGLVIVMHDATEAVRYQDLRTEFVANVSHELRTPLTAIKGFAETLRDGAMLDPQRGPQYLSTIEKHADQLTNLVNDLLELSRLESMPGLSGVLPVDIGAVAQKSADLLRSAAARKRQTLAVEIAANLPAVKGNPDYLERAVANLLDNAVKYTPPEGHIALSVRADGAHVSIVVTDNGVGIPAADVPRIFERFYRVDRSRSRDMGGTGLGLSIVKHIAQAHGGHVSVTSTPGQGSSFEMRLAFAESSALTPAR